MAVRRRRRGALLALIFGMVTSNGASAGQPEFDRTAIEPEHRIAVFAGGCFWCMEPPFDELEGVIRTISGYTGGHVHGPSYELVTRTDTGHYEAVLIEFDPRVVSYGELLEVFWININPVDASGQFCDRGDSYRSAIFPASERQDELARRSRSRIVESGYLDQYRRPMATEILPLEEFWVAEAYHQDYYLQHPFNYRYYRRLCGRDARLLDLWGPEDSRRGVIRDVLNGRH
jgi:methionine-S-sulfoxide reductase